MRQKPNTILKGIGNVFYAIMAMVIVFLCFQFALFKPFHSNVYWVFIMGMFGGGIVVYVFKKP